MFKSTASFLFTLSFVATTNAQQFSFVREHAPSFSNASQYGHVSYLGDLTGDGVAEYGVADVDTSPQLDVFNGATGLLYLSIPGTSDHFGLVGCSHPDINGDGVPDFAVGESEDDWQGLNAGRVLVLSGADGGVLRTVYGPASSAVDQGFGWDLESFVDVNGDGVVEFLAGARKGGTNGHYSGSLTCIDGATGAHVYTVHGAGAYDYASRVGSPGPDLNSDGVPDFAIGAREWYSSSGDGYLRLVSGADGSVLLTIDGWGGQEDSFGANHAWTDDLDSDGLADLVVSAPGQDFYGTDVGRVGVFSSSSGALIREIVPSFGVLQGFGDAKATHILSLPDSDGDGFGEVLIPVAEFDNFGTPCAAVFVCSPATGSILATLKDPAGGVSGFGDSMVLLDSPAAGVTRVLIGGSVVGKALVYDFLPTQGGPPPGYNWIQNPANGHRFALTVTQTWQQAATEADTLGANVELVTVRNLTENDWLWNNVANQSDAWIGYTDEAAEGIWLWRSGELTPWWASNGFIGLGGAPGNWMPGQPDNQYFGQEHYAVLQLPSAGQWNDLRGNSIDRRPAILEYFPVDADNDGLLDDDEIPIHGTDPQLFDTDGDGLGDGQELGVTYATAPTDTNPAIFLEDTDPLTTTDPLLYDTDTGGASDGNEDVNKNGAVDANEGDPNASLDDLFQMSVQGLSPNQQATISVWDCHPGFVVVPFYSLAGQASNVLAAYNQLELQLTQPVTQLTGMQASASGNAFSVVWVPPFAPIGRTVYWQAVEVAPGGTAYRPSIALTTVIQ